MLFGGQNRLGTGNRVFDGVQIFPTVRGTFLRGYVLENGRVHPLFACPAPAADVGTSALRPFTKLLWQLFYCSLCFS